MSYIICRFCHKRHCQAHTVSWKIGCCLICRDTYLPSYIAINQWKQFLDKLHRKIHDTEKGLTKRNKKILQA